VESTNGRGAEAKIRHVLEVLQRYKSLGLLSAGGEVSVTVSIASLAPNADVTFRLRPKLLKKLACLGFALEGVSFSMRHANVYRAGVRKDVRKGIKP
jgi:hypothetical protein